MSSLSFYQVGYELISDVYVAVVQHIDDNPFYSDATLQRAKQYVFPPPPFHPLIFWLALSSDDWLT